MTTNKPIIISIVEDQIPIGSKLKDYLNEQEEFCCDIHYKKGEEAIKGITSCKPQVVIMDIGLPDINGVECMKKLLPKLPSTQFIMFTIFDDDQMLFEALKSGAAGYILKDTGLNGILEAIYQVLQGGAPMSPSIAKKVISSFKKDKDSTKFQSLTAHQKEILKFVSQGLLNKEIAANLNVVEGTVKNQIRTIYSKLQVNNRVEASSLFRDLS